MSVYYSSNPSCHVMYWFYLEINPPMYHVIYSLKILKNGYKHAAVNNYYQFTSLTNSSTSLIKGNGTVCKDL